MIDENNMPILISQKTMRIALKNCPDFIPMICLDANQAIKNHDQTLDRLRQRGGVSPSEALALIQHRAWHPMLHQEAVDRLNDAVKRMLG
ncbi:hypothetical protein LCGC14_2045840 [marine sediment metagenome]|uniref:Uncharacterized protein n=1 Tax=marine sediment metagenome TaxID=412755 RepID=A0A0F9FD45_9ZZZZ